MAPDAAPVPGTHWHTDAASPPRECNWACHFFCFFGMHRWCLVCERCECCGKADDFLMERRGVRRMP